MNLVFRNKVLIANKWLVLLSGLKRKKVLINGIRDTEKHYFRIPDAWAETSWTKSLIKQVLAYLGLTDSNGDLGVIDMEELSKFIHCSVRTIRNNNKTLESLGLIRVEYLYGELCRVVFVNYKEDFLDLYETTRHSTGYTSIQREALFDLFKISDVNQLRIACRALYVHEKEVHLEGNPSALLTQEDFKDFLPRYVSFRPVLERKVRKLRFLFEKIETIETRKEKSDILLNFKQTPSLFEKLKSPFMISFKLVQHKDSRAMDRVEEDAVYYSLSYDFLKLHKDIGIEEVPYQTLLELTRDYGKIPVQRAVSDLIHYWENKWDEVSETLSRVKKEVDKLRFADHPVGYLRKIFKEYSRSYQEEGFFAPC